MLPLSLTGLAAGSVLLSHRSAAAEATAVDHRVGELSEFVRLSEALRDQYSVAAFDVRFAELGVVRSDAIAVIGFDWAPPLAPARAQADRALASLGAESPVSARTLTSLYAAIDTGEISSVEAARRLGDYARTVVDTLWAGLDQLQAAQHDTALLNAVESVRVATVLLDVATPQVIDLSAIWFPAPEDGAQQTTAVVARLSAENATYTSGIASLRQLDVPSIDAVIDAIDGDPQVRAFSDAIARSLLGVPFVEEGVPIDIEVIGDAFRGHLVLDEHLDDLVLTATAQAQLEARHLASVERAGFVTWALLAAGLAADLGRRRAVARPGRSPGPSRTWPAMPTRSTRATSTPSRPRAGTAGPARHGWRSSVFTDLVANLQLLDAKANALAHCDFDDPVLGRAAARPPRPVARELGRPALRLDRRARPAPDAPRPRGDPRLADGHRQPAGSHHRDPGGHGPCRPHRARPLPCCSSTSTSSRRSTTATATRSATRSCARSPPA